MPGLNARGPGGYGPETGRRRGSCFGRGSGSQQRGACLQGFGRQGGRGQCRRQQGCGRRGLLSSGNANVDEHEMLLQEKSWLEQRLNAIKERLSNMD